jgi:hypothetical protein
MAAVALDTCNPLLFWRDSLMRNVKLAINGKLLTITVDLSKEQGESKSGKSVVIGSSDGNVDVPGAKAIKLGLNVYRAK